MGAYDIDPGREPGRRHSGHDGVVSRWQGPEDGYGVAARLILAALPAVPQEERLAR
jgi:hypothetical protein